MLQFTRPDDTDAYAAGDVVASATDEAVASAALLSWRPNIACRLVRVGLHRSQATATDAAFQLLILSQRPDLTNGDNGALAGDFSASIVGELEVAAADQRVLGDGAYGVLYDVAGDSNGIVLDEREYFFVLVANDTYTPEAEEVFTLTPQTIAV